MAPIFWFNFTLLVYQLKPTKSFYPEKKRKKSVCKIT